MKSSSRPNRGSDVNVVYVLKRNAKAAKSALEMANVLNKNFRMIPADPDVAKDCIALPVSDKFEITQEGSWKEYIQTTGTQLCPYSTAVLGNRGQLAQTSNYNDKNLTLVQQAILRTIQKISSSNSKEAELIDQIQKLDQSVCPKKLEIFGDDRTLVVPPLSFDEEAFQSILCSDSQENEASCRTELWRQLAQVHDSPRIVRRGTVDPNSRIRESGHRLLFPHCGIPDTTGW
jgi:hypothetical protein